MNEVVKNIYITHNYNYNYEPAKKYLSKNGRLIYITNGKINIEKIRTLALSISKEIESITPDDYLLLAGNIVVNSITCALVYEKIGRINLLIWDARKSVYIFRQISHTDFFINHPQNKILK